MREHQIQCLLMGGQACVLYGAAEFSRDTDLEIVSLPLIAHAISKEEVALSEALEAEERQERTEDQAYWQPLKRELERLRREQR